MTDRPIGNAVELRYKELGLTQESLAALAGVSLTTVQNVLHGRVGVARTWPRIERALGWHDSLNALQAGQKPRELLPTEALKSLFAALTRLIANDDPATENALRLWENLANNILVADDAILGTDSFARGDIEHLWPHIRRELSPSELEPLAEAFRDFGWREPRSRPPEGRPSDESAGPHEAQAIADDVAAALSRDPGCGCKPVFDKETRLKMLAGIDALARDTEGMNAFRRLPLRVQEALSDGEVLDSDTTALTEDGDMTIVTMVVRRGGSPTTAEDRTLLVNSLRVWHMALATSAMAYDYYRAHGGQLPDDIEKKMRETLQAAGSQSKPGETEI